MNTHRRVLLAACLAGAAALTPLHSQVLLVRPKVSETLTDYRPKVRIKGVLQLPGSLSISDVGEEWGRTFRQFHPDGRIAFIPMQSSEAAKALIDGSRQVVMTAREFTPEEMAAFRARFNYMPMRIPVALDANIVFVNKSNSLTSITMQQLDAAYSKDRKGGAKEPAVTWADLGGRGEVAKRNINAYSREEGDAIRAAFAASALQGGAFRAGIILRNDFSSLAESVLTDIAGIAFGPMSSWYSANKILSVVPYEGSDARYPTQENVTTSRYPMVMIHYAYVNRAPGAALDPAVDEFLHMALAKEGQNAVADGGLFPGPLEFLTIALKRLDR